MINVIKREVFSAFLFSGLLILIYYLRSNGFKSAVIVLSVYLFLLFAYLSGFKVGKKDLILGPMLIGTVSLPYASRGPSFTDSLFILSFSAPIYAILSSAVKYREKKKAIAGYILLSLLAPISVWGFSANWEYPSTFSPFLIYGVKEVPWIVAAIIFALIFFPFKSKKDNLFLASLVFSIIFLILINRLDSKVLTDVFPFGFKNSIFMLIFLDILFFLFLESLRSYSAKFKEGIIPELTLARFNILIPVLITLIFIFLYNLRSFLPIPFSTVKILSATVFAVCSFGVLLLKWRVKNLNYSLVFIFVFLFILRLALPVESNNINYIGETYSFYSMGYEHLGIWAVFLILLLIQFLKSDQKILSSIFLVGCALSLTELYYSRLYHIITWIPIQVFKDLGTEGVSWVRKPICPSENIIFPLLVSIIIVLSNFKKNEADI